ncbi:cupin domain-containing protein [Sulfurimonas marina]|uniref:Cupin domain-containing protein n=1 Tax=Sulfurimonas marina TaxID=2590551 RepID=A0A7M1AUM0_9BACT|nr:cupin domain-containing protein [Sulfurimonas marina]QOP41124.1 cupin domain-containing protein [Sulfurimonas marina]
MSSEFFDYSLPELDSEDFTTLLEHKNVKISRIISNTLKTEQKFLSEKDEWVIVLQGCAKLEMNGTVHKLTKGSSLFIPANTEHKLLKTKKVVVWLAVYID